MLKYKPPELASSLSRQMRWPVSLSTQVFGGSSARARGTSAVRSARDDTVDRRTEDIAELSTSVRQKLDVRRCVTRLGDREKGYAGCERFIHCDGCEWEIVSYSE